MKAIGQMLFCVLMGVLFLGASGARAQDTMTLDLGGGIILETLLVPAGEFDMGSNDGEAYLQDPMHPVHHVTLTKPFYIGIYEVTQEQYLKIMGVNPSIWGSDPKNPVDYITYDASQEFCRKVSEKTGKTVRLPTEAEWEYACRAGTTTAYCCGDQWDGAYGVFSEGASAIVGSKLPNAWGLYDMHGNVWERVNDWYAPYTTDPQVDPQGPATGESHVIRGGSRHGACQEGRSASRIHIFSFGNIEDGRGVGLRVVVEANQISTGGPRVSITSPTNHAAFTAGDNIAINATASDTNGTVTKVEFYQGTTKLGEDATSPYSYTWNNVAAGSYTLTAKATDNNSLVSISAVASISVRSTNSVLGNVGLNFIGNAHSMAASASAGAVVAFANWNNLSGVSGSSSSLLMSTGGVSGLRVAWDGFEGIYNTRSSATNGDEDMMWGYCDNTAAGATVTVSFITAPLYDVYVYFSSDTDGRTGTVGINGASTYSFATYGNSSHSFPSGYRVTSDTGTAYPNANYAVWSNLTGSSFAMTMTKAGNNNGLNGMQIVMHGGTPAATNKTAHGIPYSWLASYGIANTNNSVETDNADGDSLNNLQEYVAGTDPTNRNSCFVMSITNMAGQIVVRVPSVQATGGKMRYYDIELRTNLSIGSWQPVSNYTNILGDGSVITCANATQDHARFYRAKVHLQ
jgi:formylglycine-generating enzyme required for sulfatase activity